MDNANPINEYGILQNVYIKRETVKYLPERYLSAIAWGRDDGDSPTIEYLYNQHNAEPMYMTFRLYEIENMSDEQLLATIKHGRERSKHFQSVWAAKIAIAKATIEMYSLSAHKEYQDDWKDAFLYCKKHKPEDVTESELKTLELYINARHGTAGYVYCLSDSVGHYKLGRTIDMKRRVSELRTQPPFRIQTKGSSFVFNAHYYEKCLHDHFARHRLNGEWFELTDDQVSSVLDRTWAREYYLNKRKLGQEWGVGK